MKSCNIFLLLFLAQILVSTSCVTHRKLTYLEDKSKRDIFLSVPPETYKIQPYDNLFIRVVTPDPKWSDMFNTMPATSSTYGINEQTADMLSYAVDDKGAIRLPYAGKFMVAGKTLDIIKTELETALKPYVTDAVVTVKMVNNYVSVIGEVQRPGRYPIYKDRLNIFQALAMAGDMSEYSNRRKVLLIRQTPSGNMVKELSLRDRNIMTSELFYVMPNDVIYAQPMRGKFFQMSSFPYSVLLSTITTFVLLWNVLK
jgi:polysaccharide export outer membrane protein